MMSETVMAAERIGNFRQRFAQILSDHFFVRNVVGDFAQAVHVVGNAEQADGNAGVQRFKRVHHHCCSGDFAECADMRQS